MREWRTRQREDEVAGKEAELGDDDVDQAMVVSARGSETKTDSKVAGVGLGAAADATDEISNEGGQSDHDVRADGREPSVAEARSPVADAAVGEQSGEAGSSERADEDLPASEQERVDLQQTAGTEGTDEDVDSLNEADRMNTGSGEVERDSQPPSSPSAIVENENQDPVLPEGSREERKTAADEGEQVAQPTTPALENPAPDATASTSPRPSPCSRRSSVSAAEQPPIPNESTGDATPTQADDEDDEANSLEEQLARAFEDDEEGDGATSETGDLCAAATSEANDSGRRGAQGKDSGFDELFGQEDVPDAEGIDHVHSLAGGDDETPAWHAGEEERPSEDNETDHDLLDHYSADEDDDSDADESLHPNSTPDYNDGDDDFSRYEDRAQGGEDGYDHQFAQNSWRGDGMGYGMGDVGTFLPDAMMPDTYASDPAAKPSDSTSADLDVAQIDPSTNGGENDKKRKLSDGLSSLAPEIRAAFVDSTGNAGTGRYYGISTPDGPKQKRPRLKRPGEERSAVEKPA